MKSLHSFLAVLSLSSLLLCSTPFIATAQESETPLETGTIRIEQKTPLENIFAEWTLIKPGNTSLKGRHQTQTLSNAAAGNYTMIVEPLDGATASMKVFFNGDLVEFNEHAQATFTLAGGDDVLLIVENTFTRVGGVSVSSVPLGLS
ncbi:MAG: hypothetical protein WCX61_05615, partial [Candidatus Peribacteraceae bacterium]